MKRRNIFPEGLQIISVPFDLLPVIMLSLHEMPLVLPAYEHDGNEYVKKMKVELGLD